MQPGRGLYCYGTFRTSKGGGRVIIRYGRHGASSEIADEAYASRTYNGHPPRYVYRFDTQTRDGWG